MSNLSKENLKQKKLKYHQTCQTLPLRKLINLQNSVDENGVADSRHILIDDIWPEDYNDPDLIPATEKILVEWNKLNGHELNLEEEYYKKDKLLYERNKLQCLDLAYKMINSSEIWEFLSVMKGGAGRKKESAFLLEESKKIQEEALDLLKQFGFKNIKTKNDIIQKHKQVTQKLMSDVVDERNNNKKPDLIFEDFIIPIATTFKMNPVDLYNITCSMYVSFVNRMIKMNEQSKKK